MDNADDTNVVEASPSPQYGVSEDGEIRLSDAEIASLLENYVNQCTQKFEDAGDMDSLKQAKLAVGSAICHAEVGLPETPTLARLNCKLGRILRLEYERTGDDDTLQEAVSQAYFAANMSLEYDSDERFWYANSLGETLSSKYERTKDVQDLERAIAVCRRATEAPLEDPMYAEYIATLGSMLASMFDRSGNLQDLDEAISLYRKAQEFDNRQNARAIIANNLGTALHRRYEQTKQVQDLEEAIALTRSGIDLLDAGHPYCPVLSYNLALWLNSQYSQTGDADTLEEAINSIAKSVAQTPTDHPIMSVRLGVLSSMLEDRYRRSGSVWDLETAIELGRRAVALRPSKPYHGNDDTRVYRNLALCLGLWHDRTGEMRALDEAIILSRHAMESMPDDDTNKTAVINSMSIHLLRRYERTRDLDQLSECVELSELALKLSNNESIHYGYLLNTLANALLQRYLSTKNVDDLDRVIRLYREAVAHDQRMEEGAGPGTHTQQANRLANLSKSLWLKYRSTGETGYFSEAIQVSQEAVQATVEGDSDRGNMLSELGCLMSWNGRITGAGYDEECIDMLLEAWFTTASPPLVRLKAGVACLRILSVSPDLDIGVKLGKEILNFMPSVNTQSLDRSDRLSVASEFADSASLLCALLLNEGCIDEALESLEQGRATVISQLLDDRSDLTKLSQDHPELVGRYNGLLAEVNAPIGRQMIEDKLQFSSSRRREAAEELSDCIAKMKLTSGDSNLFADITVTEMQRIMPEGYIATVNVTEKRSHVMLLSRDRLTSIALPGMTEKDVRRWVNRSWLIKKRAEQRKKNDEFLEYLAWLWNTCVKHVIHEIYSEYKTGQTLPRVWWIGAGLASAMPFHAAGIHREDSTETALHNTISSYSPSVKALIHARKTAERERPLEADCDPMIVVTMPTTPAGPGKRKALPPLRGAMEESNRIIHLIEAHPQPSLLEPVRLDQPDADTVIENLENCYIAHFACHATTDDFDPSNSGLILQKRRSQPKQHDDDDDDDDGGNGPDDFVQDPLPVSRIFELNLRRAYIAYLSACSTANNPVASLSDEVIHVVSGFQVAGFPHVVGCLWPAGDDECVEVAERFYRELLGLGSGGEEADKEEEEEEEEEDGEVAKALRKAVMGLREFDLDMPLRWAPFVHFGA